MCAKVWLIRLTLLIQKFVHAMWKTKNEAIHAKEDSDTNKKGHEELNLQIDQIFQSLPRNKRVLPASDRAFFAKGAQRTKEYRLQKKKAG